MKTASRCGTSNMFATTMQQPTTALDITHQASFLSGTIQEDSIALSPLNQSFRKGEGTVEGDFITVDQGDLDSSLVLERTGSQTAYHAKRFSSVEGAYPQ